MERVDNVRERERSVGGAGRAADGRQFGPGLGPLLFLLGHSFGQRASHRGRRPGTLPPHRHQLLYHVAGSG